MWYWIIGLSIFTCLVVVFFANASKLNKDLGYDEWDSEDEGDVK